MSEQIWFKIEMFLYMYIVIYIFFEYTKMYIYIFLFTDIIYNTPAQKVYFTQIPLHSWCLEKNQVAAAELLRDSVQWLGLKCKQYDHMDGQTQW